MSFSTDAAKSSGPWLNSGTEPILRAIAILNDCFNYADLVGVIPADHDDRHCWTLVFVGECNEGVLTVNVGTHKGTFFIEEPVVRTEFAPWNTVEEVCEAFAAIRSRYEDLWKNEPQRMRGLAALLDRFAGRKPA